MSRGGIDFEGLHATYSSWKAATAIQNAVAVSGVSYIEGKAVTITGNGEAGFGSAGDPVLGKVLKYEGDGNVTVQDGGYTEFPGVSGNLPTAGSDLVVDGSGAVTASAGATGPAKAVSVDSGNNTVMVFIG